jgi:hypothetical protein
MAGIGVLAVAQDAIALVYGFNVWGARAVVDPQQRRADPARARRAVEHLPPRPSAHLVAALTSRSDRADPTASG